MTPLALFVQAHREEAERWERDPEMASLRAFDHPEFATLRDTACTRAGLAAMQPYIADAAAAACSDIGANYAARNAPAAMDFGGTHFPPSR